MLLSCTSCTSWSKFELFLALRVLVIILLGVAALWHLHGPSIPSERPAARVLDTRAVDGLRGLATLWIFCYHYLVISWTAAERTVFGFKLDLLGEAAIPFFYILSGFVLALNHVGKLDVPTFYVRRAARILPLYYVSEWMVILILFATHWLCFVLPDTNEEVGFCNPRSASHAPWWIYANDILLPYGCFERVTATDAAPSVLFSLQLKHDNGWSCAWSTLKTLLCSLGLGIHAHYTYEPLRSDFSSPLTDRQPVRKRPSPHAS